MLQQFPKGRVEVSVDGRVWSRTGTVSQKTGVCAFQQRTGIRFLRLLPEPRLPSPSPSARLR